MAWHCCLDLSYRPGLGQCPSSFQNQRIHLIGVSVGFGGSGLGPASGSSWVRVTVQPRWNVWFGTVPDDAWLDSFPKTVSDRERVVLLASSHWSHRPRIRCLNEWVKFGQFGSDPSALPQLPTESTKWPDATDVMAPEEDSTRHAGWNPFHRCRPPLNRNRNRNWNQKPNRNRNWNVMNGGFGPISSGPSAPDAEWSTSRRCRALSVRR